MTGQITSANCIYLILLSEIAVTLMSQEKLHLFKLDTSTLNVMAFTCTIKQYTVYKYRLMKFLRLGDR